MEASSTVRSLPDGAESALCYSGFRAGQNPDRGVFPSADEIREDLHLLQGDFRHLRLYDCDALAENVLRLIQEDELDFRVMLGAWLAAEQNNDDCPWGGVYSEAELERNRSQNSERIKRLAELAQRYPRIVSSVSAGNEATVAWTDHLVPVSRVTELVRQLRAAVPQPVTFCENYVPWLEHLAPLAEEVDFLSVHIYPVWEYRPVEQSLDWTRDIYARVAAAHPDKPLVITEAGWTTRSNGRGIPPENVSEEQQAQHLAELSRWSREEGVLTYVFEAFDESWKGSPDPDEPEKHWGLYREDRSPKPGLEAWRSER